MPRFHRSAAAVLLASALALTAHRIDVAAQSNAGKLATVLADLVQALPQAAAAPGPALSGTGSGAPAPQSALSYDAFPPSVQDAIKGRWLRIDQNNAAQLYVLVNEVTDSVVSQLTAAGATIEIRDAARRRVQARIPLDRIQAVAALSSVDEIRLPTYARRRAGTAVSEGDSILHTDAVRNQWFLDGAGVRVGVISDGLKGVFDTNCTTCGGVANGPIASGDLPSSQGTRTASGVLTSSIGGIVARSFQANGDLEGLPPATPACGFAGAGGEGTALLEIVHDLAPSAKLSFANFDTDLAFTQAVNFLAASNDVVLDDIGFYGVPFDGTSLVSTNTAAALNNPAYPIRAYFTAAGNDADEHYYGAYTNSGVDGSTVSGITNSGKLHLFQRTSDTTDALGLGAQPYNVIALPANGEAAIFLSWDDTFGASANNYDLYLVQQSTGRVVASSTTVQSGRQDPTEFIDYVNRGSQDFFRIVVQNVRDSAQPRHLNLFSFQPECASGGPLLLTAGRHERVNYNTATRSISAQSDAGGSPVSVVAVGAICSATAAAAGRFGDTTPNESCLDVSNSTAEFYSSRGPTLDGRVKPDVAGIDGVTITGAGSFSNPFFGTSAAAPHLGAIAAVVLQGAPCLLSRSTTTIDAASARSTLRNLLVKTADRLGDPDPNNLFGSGRVNAVNAVQATLPTWNGKATINVDGNVAGGASLTPAQLGFADPTNCGLVSLNWTGGCGTSPGATMTCPFGGSAVTVSASNNGYGFSDAHDINVVVSNFAAAVSPASATIAAGQSAKFTVTLTPQVAPFRTPITLTCDSTTLPPNTACAFNPPTVTLGPVPVQSTMTLTTTAASGLGAVTRPRKAGLAWPPIDFTRMRPAPSMVLWPFAALLVWGAMRRPRVTRRATAAAVCALTLAAVLGQAIFTTVPALADAGIALFPSSLTFDSQIVSTTAPAQLVHLTNVGADALSLTTISTTGDFGQTNDCGASVDPGKSCTIAVTFAPVTTGSRTGSLTIADSAAGSPHTINLAGTGGVVPASGTPTGTYAIGVGGTSGSLLNTAVLTLTVQ
ncbi:MAG: choice-of-anchor D domain-containing protein [Acidobacteriia bacterium]|nr:choice-of-anchor D domain-containing protein [Terriglobia bacterium]